MDRELRDALIVFGAVAVIAASGQARERQQRPDAGSSPMTLAIVKGQLSNGLHVWIVEQHDLPVVQMSLQVLTGADADPQGRYGIASLTAAMLTEGAGTRSGADIADAVDDMVANLSASSGVDASSLQLYVPVARLADALPIMADVSQRPTFPTEALEKARRQRLATLQNARDDPDAIAALAFARGAYGPSDRRAATQIGTTDSLKAMTRADLERFHQAAYRPGNSTLIVVGDVTPDRVLPMIETHFGKWQPERASGAVDTPARAQASERPPYQIAIVDMPDAPQSRILIGGVGGSGSMSDLFASQVLNAVLRARFASGRNPTLRDYTAGVRSGFDMSKSATPFVVSAAAQSGKTAESVGELLNELAAVVTGIPADELARAKDGIAAQFPKTFQATGRISSRLQAIESLVVYGLPDDYYANYAAAIQAVAAADVQRVAQQYFRPDHLAIVIAGDRKTIEAPLRALKVGPITLVSIDELLAPDR